MCNILLYPWEKNYKKTESILGMFSSGEAYQFFFTENISCNIVEEISLHQVNIALLNESLIRDKEVVKELIDKIVKNTDVKVLVMTKQLHQENGIEYFKAGAVGHLLIDELDSLPHRLESIKQECVTMPISIATDLLESVQQSEETMQLLQNEVEKMRLEITLSEKEIEILKYVNNGLSQEEIAQEAHISLHTVKTHLMKARRKLGVKTSKEAATVASEVNLWK